MALQSSLMMGEPLSFIETRILELARLHGLDTTGIGANGSMIGRHQPDAEIEALAELFRQLRRLLNDELIGMTARPVPAGTFDIVMKSALQSQTLGEYIGELIAAAHLMYSPPNLYCGIDSRHGLTTIRYENAYRPDDDFYFVYGFMATHRGMSWLADERILLKHISLRSARHEQLAELCHLFQCEVRLQQPHNAIAFDTQYMTTPVRRSSSELNEYLRRRPLDVLYLPGTAHGLRHKAVRLLQARLDQQQVLPATEDLAAQLSLSEHGLRRQLAREGTRLQDLKDEVRYARAAQQLANSLLPIGEIADALGFAEPNSFGRAFKRWSGLAPQQYRQRHSSLQTTP